MDIDYIDQNGLNWLLENAGTYGFKPFGDHYDYFDNEKESWHWEWRPN